MGGCGMGFTQVGGNPAHWRDKFGDIPKIKGHFRYLHWRYRPHIQYLHFRVLKVPLTKWNIYSYPWLRDSKKVSIVESGVVTGHPTTWVTGPWFFQKGSMGMVKPSKKTASPAILVLGTSRRRGEPHNSRSSTSGPRQPRRLSKKYTMFVKSSSDTHISVYASYSKCTITSAYYIYLHIQCIYNIYTYTVYKYIHIQYIYIYSVYIYIYSMCIYI